MVTETKPEKRALARFLFHLGKGLWKSVPLIGPLVDEVVYTQYESKLLQKMDGLSEEDVRRIAEALPKLSEEGLAERLREISMDTQIVSLTQFSRVLEDIHSSHTDILAGISGVTEKLDDLPSILAMIREVRQRIEDRSAIEELLVEYENRRQAWIARISSNQRKLLEQIPDTFAALALLWEGTLCLIPGCGYKEFRFRLHELEWLGLVERRLVPAGEPDAGNPPVRFDVAGAGDGVMDPLNGHEAGNGGHGQGASCTPPRRSPTRLHKQRSATSAYIQL